MAAAIKTVVVSLPQGAPHDLKMIQKLQADVYGRLGCPNCHSGFDILFREENVEHFAANKAGQITKVGG